MAFIESVMRRVNAINIDTSTVDMPEGEVTLVDKRPSWPPGAQDSEWDRAFSHGYANDDTTDDELDVGEDTAVDVPALGREAVPEDTMEETEPTLLDTPTLSTPVLTTARPGAPVRPASTRTTSRPSSSHAVPVRPTARVPSLQARSGRPPGVPQTSTYTSAAPVSRRDEREALARVIALAKPRVTPPRPRPIVRPLRTDEG